MSGAIGPAEDDPPLLVDADAVVPAPAPAKNLQPIARRRSEIQEGVRSVEHVELSDRDAHDIARKGAGSSGANTVVEVGGRPVAERRDHLARLSDTRYPCNTVPWLPHGRLCGVSIIQRRGFSLTISTLPVA